jgi:hypothetical protein
MPMVGGKEYPYTKEGKMAAKKAALKMKTSGKKSTKKQKFSGVASQIYS